MLAPKRKSLLMIVAFIAGLPVTTGIMQAARADDLATSVYAVKSVYTAKDVAWQTLPPEDQALFVQRLGVLKANFLDRPRKLREQLIGLAQAGTAIDIHMLLAFIDDPQNREAAIEALGYVANPHARSNLAARVRLVIADPGVSLSMVAIRSYARLLGDAAIPEVRQYIDGGWRAHNGSELMVCGAGVKALGDIPTPASAAALVELLNNAPSRLWLPDFGSEVVCALVRVIPSTTVGQPTTGNAENAQRALLTYADTLRRKMPGPDNAPGRAYYEVKIREAVTAAATFSRE